MESEETSFNPVITEPDRIKIAVIPDDNAVVRLVIRQLVDVLNGPTGRPRTRQRSLAVTKLEEAFLWLGEDIRVS